MSTTVTGNINDLTGTAVTSNCYVRFWLRGCNGNQPRVGGSALIAPDNGPTYFQDFVPNGSGQISGTLYSNDVNISAGGQVGVTWYGVQVFLNGIPGAETPYSLADGVSFNLNSATPISTNPVVAAPTGDSSYVRLDDGNIASAANPFLWSTPINFKTHNNIRFADQFASLNAAVTDLGGGGVVYLSPNTTYTVTSTISIASSGVVIKGAGFTSAISVNHTSDVFQVSAALFRLEDCEVSIASTSTRSGSAIVNANNANAQQGCIRNVRFTGNGTTPNNGSIFLTATPGVGIWQFDKLRVPGGATWNSLASIASATSTTVASFQFSDVVGSAKYVDGGFVLDGSVDTVQFVNVDITSGLSGSGPMLWCRNTLAAPINPRWVHCSNFAVECQGGTAITLDAVRDFKNIGGYFATCTTAIAIGANALMASIAECLFTNIGASAITVNAAALHTIIHHCDFEDTCNSADNTFDTISVTANTTDIEISFNQFRTTGSNKPAHFVNLSGTTDNYVVVGNDFKGTTSTSAITNSASGSNRIVFGNLPNAAIANSINASSTFNGGYTFNAAGTFNAKPVVAAGVGVQLNGSTSGSISITPPAISGSFTSSGPFQLGATSQRSESAADTNVITVTPPAAAGTYRLNFVLSLSAASAAVVGWTATWKDSNGTSKTPTNLSLYQVGTAAPALTFTTSTTDDFYGSAEIDIDNSATAIVIKFTLGSGTITAKASATIERLI